MRENRLSEWFVFGVMALIVVLTIGYPLTFDGKTLFSFPTSPWLDPEAAFAIDAPTARIIHNILMDGDVPLWNPYSGIGSSLIADPHVSYFSPFRLIVYLFPGTVGWDVFTILRLIALIYFTYHLLIRLDIEPFLGLCAAILYGYSGHVFHFLNLTHINSVAFIPLFLEGVVCTLQRNYRAALPRVAIGLALMIFGGGLLDSVLTGVLTALLAVAFLVTSGRNVSRLDSTARIGVLSLYIVLGVALCSVFLVPYIELREHAIAPFRGRSTVTFNDPAYSLAMFASTLYKPPEDISNYYMRFRQYTHLVILPGLLLAPLGLSNRRTRAFCAATLAFVALYWSKLYGLDYLEFVNSTPFLRDVRFEKYQAVLHLCLYCLAAIGLNAVVRSKTSGTVWALYAAGAGAALLPFALIRYVETRPELPGAAFAYSALVIVLVAIVAMSQRSQGPENRRTRVVLACATILLVLVQIRLDLPRGLADRDTVFPDESRYHFKLLERLTDNARMMTFTGYNPKVWSGYRIRDVRDFSIVHVQRYRNLFKSHVERRHCWHFMALCSDDPESFNIALAKRLGVRYLVVDRAQLAPLQRNPYRPYEPISADGETLILDLGNINPLIEVFEKVREAAPKVILNTLAHKPDESRDTAYVEDAVEWNEHKPQPLRFDVEDQHWGNNEIRFTTNSSRNVFVVVKNQYYPGWRAYIDGRPADLVRTNYLFQGVAVPAGRHTLTLRYVPYSLVIGLMICALGALGMTFEYRRLRNADDPTPR